MKEILYCVMIFAALLVAVMCFNAVADERFLAGIGWGALGLFLVLGIDSVESKL